MPDLIDYLLKVSIALALVYLFYQLVLRRLTFYNWNRWYLVGYSIMSFLIPFMNITGFLFRHELDEAQIVRIVPVYNIQLKEAGFEWNQWTVAMALLITGMLLMGIRMLLQLLSLRRMQTKAVLLNEGDIKLFHVEEQIMPFSFNNGIYINSRLHTEAELQEIIRHEFVHVKQKHSIDILLAEVLCTLLWFHPAAWLIRKAIRQNLEFIADEKVLQDGVDKKQYQYLLLKVVGNNHYSIAPNFNFSSLKNRIVMMNQIKSARVQIIRFLFVLPLLAVLLLAFREVRQKESRNSFQQQNAITADTVPVNDIASVNVNKNGDEAIISIILKDGTTDTYNLNDPIQKEAFEKKYGKLERMAPPPPPPSIETVDVNKKDGKNTITIRLADGKVKTFDMNDPRQKEILKKQYGLSEAGVPPPPPPVPAKAITPAHEVKLNNKGYYVSIADNMGESIVIIKDKKKNIVEALKLSDWNKNESRYKTKYGEIPPPPPPALAPSVSVTVATSPVVVTGVNVTTSPVVAVSGISPATVIKGVAVSPVSEVKITGIQSSAQVSPVVETKITQATAPAVTEQKIQVSISGKNGMPAGALYYIDGKEASYEDVEKLDPDFIESINVLKGENATKVYGEKGKNGVIIITTKKRAS